MDEQEVIHHRVDRDFALSHTDGLDKDSVIARSLTQHDGLARLACHTTQ